MGLPKIKVKRNTKTLFPFPCPEICLCWCSLLGIYTPIWGFGSHLKYLPQSVCVWGFKGFSSRSQSCCCSGHVGRPNKSFELVRPSVKVLTHPQPCKPDHNSRSGSCGGGYILIMKNVFWFASQREWEWGLACKWLLFALKFSQWHKTIHFTWHTS